MNRQQNSRDQSHPFHRLISVHLFRQVTQRRPAPNKLPRICATKFTKPWYHGTALPKTNLESWLALFRWTVENSGFFLLSRICDIVNIVPQSLAMVSQQVCEAYMEFLVATVWIHLLLELKHGLHCFVQFLLMDEVCVCVLLSALNITVLLSYCHWHNHVPYLP